MIKRLTLSFSLTLSLFLSATAGEHGLDFVENRRQWTEQVRFKADIPGGAVFLTERGFMYTYYDTGDLERIHEMQHDKKTVSNEMVDCHAYEVRFVGAAAGMRVSAQDRQANYHNYFLGNDPSRWAGGVPLYRQVTYQGLYPGIDAKVYSVGTSLKYDFIVAPGAHASDISLQFDGVHPVLTAKGDLKLKTSINTILEQAPYAYQVVGGVKQQVACKYRVDAAGRVSFDFPKGYDAALPLVIDPVLVFGTYSGGTGQTYGFSATYDAEGNLYAGGLCFDAGWPTSVGAYQTAWGGSTDAGINKYSSNGSLLLYSTYFGGNGSESPNNMVVNARGQLVLCGTTGSGNMPTTPGCFDNTFNGGFDIFVARFSTTGDALLAATYVGGTNTDGSNDFTLSPNYGDQNRGEVFTDPSGMIYISGSTSSADFPTTAGAYQTALAGQQDACVFKLDSMCAAMQFSTFLGGTGDDAAFALLTKGNGQIVVVGGTTSADFPTVTGGLHDTTMGGTDGFAAILSVDGSTLVRSTFLGTDLYDHAFKVQLDPAENVYVCGQTRGNYPVSATAYSMANGSIFIDKLSADLSTSMLSTRLGNAVAPTNQLLTPTAFLYDICGNVYLCGFQTVNNLPVSPNAIQTAQGGFWLCVLTSGMSTLSYATYYGSAGDHVDGGTSRFDPQGIVYHSVCNFTGFPTTPTAWRPNDGTLSYDVASFKINFEAMGVIAGIASMSTNDSVCAPATIQFNNGSASAQSYEWHFGDGTTDTAKNPTHSYPNPGVYNVMLHAKNPDLCVTDDTAYITIYVFDVEKPELDLRDTVVCEPGQVTLTAPVKNLNGNMHFHWEPVSAILSNPDQQTVTVDGTLANTFTVKVTDSIGNICKESSTGSLTMQVFDKSLFKAFGDTTICPGDTATLLASGGDEYLWSPNHKLDQLTTPAVIAYPSTTTTYTVRISNRLGCVADRKVTVNVLPKVPADAGEDQDMKYQDHVYLHASGGVTYHWTPAATLESPHQPVTKATPGKTTTYYVEVTSAQGCKAMDSVTVNVMNAMIPTAFSPNGDGKNDVFKVKVTNPNVSLLNLSVYSRWGVRVFSTNNVNQGWDGKYQGEPVEMGTYYFVFDYSIGLKQFNEKGDLTLLR